MPRVESQEPRVEIQTVVRIVGVQKMSGSDRVYEQQLTQRKSMLCAIEANMVADHGSDPDRREDRGGRQVRDRREGCRDSRGAGSEDRGGADGVVARRPIRR